MTACSSDNVSISFANRSAFIKRGRFGFSAVNRSIHSCNDPGQRGAVALTDHELTEFT